MKEEVRKILDMLEKGQVNASQASELLDAMNAFSEGDHTAEKPKIRKKRSLRIKVNSADGKMVNVKVPAALVSAGINIGRYFGVHGGMGNQAVSDLNWEELADVVNQMLEDDETGEIVNIESERGDVVQIYLE
ncbi:MAG: hypothetical protein PHX55_04710 [Eubacteriales bacterium]|nr:hypothetical protein [Eubacteriales bacterium]MDD4462087.1 hypothetical protein [Eubacteriales bacterium]